MSNSSEEVASLYLIGKQILSVGGLFIFICGITGNVMNIIAFATLPRFSGVTTSIFLLASYLGSLLTLLTGLLPQLVSSLTGYDPLVRSLVLCKLRWFLGVGTATVAIHSLCFAMLNQYFVTTHRIRFRQFMTRQRASIICLIIYIYCGISVGPNLFFYTHVINSINQTKCDVTNSIVAVYNVYHAVFIYTIIPIFILALFSVLTWRNLRNRSSQWRPSLKQTVARMLFAQIVIVFIAAAAFCARRIYILYTADFRKDSIRIAQDYIITNVSTLFGFSLHGFTFFIYLVISKAFRKKIFRLVFHQSHRIRVDVVIPT